MNFKEWSKAHLPMPRWFSVLLLTVIFVFYGYVHTNSKGLSKSMVTISI